MKRRKDDRSPDAHLDRALSIHRRLLRVHSLVARIVCSTGEARRLLPIHERFGAKQNELIDLEQALLVARAAVAHAATFANCRVVHRAEEDVVQANVATLAPVTERAS